MPRRRNDAQQAAAVDVEHITGPTSALTSFLREQGITAEHRARQRQRQQDQTTATTTTDDTVSTQAAPAETTPVASGSKLSKGKGKKRKKDDTELVLDTSKARKSGYDGRTPGSFASCDMCSSRFTVTPYTVSSSSGGLVCFQCEKEKQLGGGLAEGAGSKPKKARAQKSKSEGALIGVEKIRAHVPTLQSVCLSILGHKIDELKDTDSLGDYMGGSQLDRVVAIVCRNRALSNDTVKLFLHVALHELKLYDCTSASTSGSSLTSHRARRRRLFAHRQFGAERRGSRPQSVWTHGRRGLDAAAPSAQAAAPPRALRAVQRDGAHMGRLLRRLRLGRA